MSVSDADISFALELFEGLGQLTTRKMMGGLCLYSDGQIFAILNSEGTLFVKAKGDFARQLAVEGAKQFGVDGKTMGYWTLPEAALDDPDLACDWARRAIAATE